MSIEEHDDGWIGSTARDVATYLRALTADAYPVEETIETRCACGNGHFLLDRNEEEGAAQVTCAECGLRGFIEDSESVWAESDPERVVCPHCDRDIFEVVVGRFPMYGEGKWVTVGVRCVGCGLLGAPVDWKTDRGTLVTPDDD